MKRPLSVTLIAGAYMLLGVISIVAILNSLLAGAFQFNLGFFLLPVGLGLRKGKPSSRRWALFWAGLTGISIAVAYIVLFASDAPAESESVVSEWLRVIFYTLPGVLLAGCIAIWRALTSPKVLAFFAEPGPAPGAAHEG
jgi:hypothetical protein